VLSDEAERDRVLGRVQESGQAREQSISGPVVRDPSGNALLLATDS
jgi:hypothetical protein